MSKTEQQLDVLKAQWRSDPCWDIYQTEGFEEHIEELKAYQQEMYIKWDNERKHYLQEKATRLNCSTQLAEYIQVLEREIKGLRDDIEAIDRRAERQNNGGR